MKNKLRCGVIGVGNMGKNHVRTYSEISDIDLVSVADNDSAVGKRIAEQYQLKFYRDYLEMIQKEDLDIVSVCVPTSLHYTIARNCIKKNINVLLEKPIASNCHEAKKLIDLSRAKKTKFLVGDQRCGYRC
jgi:predicted dehydrogenase